MSDDLVTPPAAIDLGSLPPPGIYFGLPFDIYRAAPAFSATGIKQILVSPMDFYMNSWLNAEREPEKDTPARILGSAYHTAILEGLDAFEAAYAVKPDPSEYPGVLVSADDLKAMCDTLGLPKSGTKAAMAQRIREIDAVVPLWDEIVEQFQVENADKIHLARGQWMEIRKAMFVIERMPSVRKIFTGGRAEVSIFWDAGGVPMKARLDYLKPGMIGDLKSFANINSREITEAVVGEVARNRYFIQPIVYTAAVVAAAKMLEEHGEAAVHGEVDMDWLRSALAKRPKFTFVFQQTGNVPNVLARDFLQHERYGGQGQTTNAYWTKGQMAVNEGLRRFKWCMETFGADTPWIVDHKPKAFDDSDFPLWVLDAVPELETAA
jgi:hypothetical protein